MRRAKCKHEWETMGNSTRCIICGDPKDKAKVDREARKEYLKNWKMAAKG